MHNFLNWRDPILSVALLCVNQVYYSGPPVTAAELSTSEAFVIPSRTKIAIVLQNLIESQNTSINENGGQQETAAERMAPTANPTQAVTIGPQVRAYVKENILIDGKVCIPANSIISGFVSYFCRPYKFHAYAINFNQLTLPSGRTISISAFPVVHGRIMRLYRSGEKMLLNASVGSIQTTSEQSPPEDENKPRPAVVIIGSPDFKVGDEITIEASEDIKSG